MARTLYDIGPEKALVWLPFRTQYDVGGVRSTKNLGRADSALPILQMGDGTTAATFPAQKVGQRGITYSAGTAQRVMCGVMPFATNTPFTVAGLFTMADVASSKYVWSTNNAAASGPGITVTVGTGRWDLYLRNDFTTNYVRVRTQTNSLTPGTHSVIMTYNGGGLAASCSIYQDGAPMTLSTEKDLLVGKTIQSSLSMSLGAVRAGASYGSGFSGDLLHTSVFLWALSSSEAAHLHRRMMQMRYAP